jgi:hypothetical protein
MNYDWVGFEGMVMNETKTGRKGVAAALTPPTSKRPTMVDMKQAVNQAFAFAKDFYPQAKDLRLEEVEPVSAGWSVVVSFTTEDPSSLAVTFGSGPARIFKTITIDAGSGQAQSLRVWKQ